MARVFVTLEWPFLHLLISCLVFCTFLHINTLSKNCIHKNGSIYPFTKFWDKTRSLLNLLILILIYGIIYFKYLLIWVDYAVLRNLMLTVHEHMKLCRSAACVCFIEEWLIRVLMNELILLLEITGGGNPKQLLSNWLVQCGNKGRFTSFCCKDLYVTFWVLWFDVLWLFSAHQFSLFSQSYKIHTAGHCSVTLPEMHTLLAFLCVCYFPRL
jgi:hypothetical protein